VEVEAVGNAPNAARLITLLTFVDARGRQSGGSGGLKRRLTDLKPTGFLTADDVKL
jgi:hypothetical protein